MENNLVRKNKLIHLLQKKNFEMLKDSEREAINIYLKKNRNSFVLHSLSSAITLMILKKFVFNPMRNFILSSLFEFSLILSLSASCKYFIEKTTKNEFIILDRILTENTYLLRNSILLSSCEKNRLDDNPYIGKSSLYIFNLESYTHSNLLFLVLIRLIV